MSHILVIDQGTTNSRAIVFTDKGTLVNYHQMNLIQHYPMPGWVEQDPEEMWSNAMECCRQALNKSCLTAQDIKTIGITNQRETTIIWDKQSGVPIYPAIVWQDRRTADICEKFQDHSISSLFQEKTGLLLDPYFSATKIIWILNHVPEARRRAEKNELAFGTVDSFLLWRLTKGKMHATDATNASRTLLFNIKTQKWDEDILNIFNIPKTLLPIVLDSSADFGKTAVDLLGHSIPITSMIGDQQAATVGQTCFDFGRVKITYGTGCFMLLNTGNKIIHSKNHLLSTVAYRLKGEVTYGLEGSIFSSGTIIKWLRDKLKIIDFASDSEKYAAAIQNTGGVYLIPAFTGLGAPYWEPHARAALIGMTQDTGINEIVRAGLEAVGYQSRDLLDAMSKDADTIISSLRVDGGMAANNWLLQFVADILNIEIQTPSCLEITALGAAYLAGLQVGMYGSLQEITELWKMKCLFQPQMKKAEREMLYDGWRNAIKKLIKCL